MPELPEVETIRSQLAPRLEGRTLARVEILDPRLTRPVRPLRGRRGARGRSRRRRRASREVSAAPARERLRSPRPPPHDRGFHWRRSSHERAVLELDDGTRLAYRDVRRFGTWLVLEGAELEPYLATKNGPEPLGSRFTARWLARSARPPKGAAQGRPARSAGRRGAREHLRGRGALARPAEPAASGERGLDEDEVARLTRAIRATLRTGIERQGSTLATMRRRTARQDRCRTSSASTDATASPARAAAPRSRRRASAVAAPGSVRAASLSPPAVETSRARLRLRSASAPK